MAQSSSTNTRVHFSMLRSYRLPDIITLANGAAGTGSVFATMSYLIAPDSWRIYLAMSLLPLALILDITDGKVARYHQEQSPFGRELDSLADIVSFGVAPAALAYSLGMRGALDIIILIYFVACGISRLARYNITAAELAGPSGKVKYYEGAPIPSSLILIAVLALCFHSERFANNLPFGVIEIGGALWHPLSLLFFISGSAMISKTLRIPKL